MTRVATAVLAIVSCGTAHAQSTTNLLPRAFVGAGAAPATNDGDSLTLRWEFADPLGPGEGGLVRFHCRVR